VISAWPQKTRSRTSCSCEPCKSCVVQRCCVCATSLQAELSASGARTVHVHVVCAGKRWQRVSARRPTRASARARSASLEHLNISTSQAPGQHLLSDAHVIASLQSACGLAVAMHCPCSAFDARMAASCNLDNNMCMRSQTQHPTQPHAQARVHTHKHDVQPTSHGPRCRRGSPSCRRRAR
jgi:hypothetical protein